MSLSNEGVLQPVGTGLVLREGSLQKITAGVDTQTVSMEGFTPSTRRRFCSCGSLRQPQNSIGLRKQAATPSISIN